MKPSSDIEVTTAVLHKVRDADHEWEPGCCSSEPFDRLEAEELVASFGEFGWHLSADVVMPEVAPRGRDGELVLTDFTEQVLALFLNGPLDTFALCTVYRDRSAGLPSLYPPRSFDTPRKRLAEFERAGLLRQVRAGGKQKTVKHHGVNYGVWEITDKGRAAVSRDGQAVAA